MNLIISAFILSQSDRLRGEVMARPYEDEGSEIRFYGKAKKVTVKDSRKPAQKVKKKSK